MWIDFVAVFPSELRVGPEKRPQLKSSDLQMQTLRNSICGAYFAELKGTYQPWALRIRKRHNAKGRSAPQPHSESNK